MSFLVDFDGVSHVLKSIQYGEYIKIKIWSIFKAKNYRLYFIISKEGVEGYFVFTVLSFDLTSARHIFTKEVCTSSKSWVAQGFPIIVNLNDGSKNQFNLLNFRRADFCQSMINQFCLQHRFLTGWVS